MEHVIIETLGTICQYTKITAEEGYCFYDVDDEEKNYMISISTPILDYSELTRKYIVVKGDADELNKNKEERPVYGE